jgi:hypothetical protein
MYLVGRCQHFGDLVPLSSGYKGNRRLIFTMVGTLNLVYGFMWLRTGTSSRLL